MLKQTVQIVLTTSDRVKLHKKIIIVKTKTSAGEQHNYTANYV